MKAIIGSILFTILICSQGEATHLRGGEISVRKIAEGSLTYSITVTAYTRSEGTNVLFGGDDNAFLDFGDGTKILISETPGMIRYDLDPSGNIAEASYTITHTYGGLGSYLISYSEPNRNQGVINMDNSVETAFYIESWITIDVGIENYSSPEFLTAPYFKAMIGNEFSVSMAASDENDYALFYELAIPKADKDHPVTNYKLPKNFKINPINGLITWDTMFENDYYIGEFNFAVRVRQVKDGRVIGYIVRDFQIVLEEGTPGITLYDSVNLDKYNSLVILEDEQDSVLIFAEYPANEEPITYSVYSEFGEIQDDSGSPCSFVATDSVNGLRKIKVGKLYIHTASQNVRDNPYIISIRTKFNTDIGVCFRDINYAYYTKNIDPNKPGPHTSNPPFDPVSISNESLNAVIRIFPNPVCDIMQIENPTRRKADLIIYTANGNIVSKFTIEEEITTLDMHYLLPGIYVGRLFSVNLITGIFKIVKE